MDAVDMFNLKIIKETNHYHSPKSAVSPVLPALSLFYPKNRFLIWSAA